MTKNSIPQAPVAVIGIGCIFAKSHDLKAFYRLLTRGVDGITDPPESHRHLRDYFDPDPKKPDHIYCNRGGYLPPTVFDPTEFSIPPRVIEATDTSQLLGLVTAKQALVDAGYGDGAKEFDHSKASVILGVTGTQELVIPLGARLGHPIWRRALEAAGVSAEQADDVIRRIGTDYVGWQENSFPGLLGNVVAGRIANRLDFGGTNCVVDAACASSFGALHLALMELRSGRSDIILAGGVDTINDAFMHMCFSKTQILSASGDIRPFSEKADGTVLGEGVGLVVLKRLDDAVRDDDRIYAVIKGIGAASDGNSQSIYAPRVEGQSAALRRAYDDAGIDPQTVALVEAHGTGTRVGDQVEFQALRQVFGEQNPNGNRCALGSVKSNIGHTKAAAGTAGLIKAALAVYHKVLPPTLKADNADPKLGVENSPFYLNTRLRPWLAADGGKRRAGVSAFGFGGSNFHVVLEEHRSEKTEISWDGAVEIAAFSGSDRPALMRQLEEFTSKSLHQPRVHRIGRLARQSRRRFDHRAPHRLVLVLELGDGFQSLERTCASARRQLAGADDAAHPQVFLGSGEPDGPIAFLFPGQGSQYTGMARDLVCAWPAGLAALEEASKYLDGEDSLADYIYPRITESREEAEARLRQTQVAQPALGAVSVSMLQALNHFGIRPAATCGHSYGELVALHAAGWLSREDLWELSAVRGRLMAEAGSAVEDAGTMLAVQAPIDEIATLADSLGDAVILANRNSLTQGVLSGTNAGIEAAAKVCSQKGWRTIKLPVAAAFHSPLVADAQIPFARSVEAVTFTPGSVTVMSNSLGTSYPRDMEKIQSLLGRQLASPVHFADNLQALYREGIRTFIEVGPKAVLSRLAGECLEGQAVHLLAMDPSMGRGSGISDLAAVLARLAAMGHEVTLDRWEKPAPSRRKTRMTINLSGTNYRQPGTTNPEDGRGRRTKPAEKLQDPVLPETSRPAAMAPIPAAGTTSSPKAPEPVKSDDAVEERRRPVPTEQAQRSRPRESIRASAALATVQQGLASLQSMQAQTARAHEKFLETQAEASRSLQQLIQAVRHLKGGDSFTGRSEVEFQEPSQAIPETPSPLHASLPQPPVDGPPVRQQAVPENRPSDTESHPRSKPTPGAAMETDAGHQTLSGTLIGIVSELTGYPEEMLGVEMDIESDLGIDSIKRVEILSALEERMPQLPKVTPDLMGSLKTLGQIVDFLTADAPAREEGHAPAPPPPTGDDHLNVSGTLIGIVSELTGYPEEMLGVEMDIEADLGIDSIKRVEILSALEERMPELPKVTPDLMGSLKTLGQIIDYLIVDAGPENVPETTSVASKPAPQAPVEPLERKRLIAVDLPALSDFPMTNRGNSRVAVVGGSDTIADALVKAFDAAGVRARRLTDPGKIADQSSLAGLLMLAPLPPLLAFQWAQACHPMLSAPETTETIGPFIAGVTFLDGAFGLADEDLDDPEQGALAGLVKTAAREWTRIRPLALDIDPRWDDPMAMARAVVREIIPTDGDAELEVGLSPQRRVGLRLKSEEIGTSPEALSLSPEDVVVISGGARGVTAEAALALIRHTPCRLVLLGRSPEPVPEPEWLSPLTDAGEMKKAIFQHAFRGQAPSPSPREVEAIYRRLTANREIADTMEAIENAGGHAVYHAVDVRDARAVRRTLETVRNQLGPIKGVIHGAGVLEDRLIADKQTDQFERVYSTKVDGLKALLEATREDELKYLVLFSSVSARMGNRGQVDYAMANEALNKMARRQSRRRPQCRVVSINWGPWDGGMVTPGLRRNFLDQGVSLIPPASGADALLAEMAIDPSGPVEVVIGASLPAANLPETGEETPNHAAHHLASTCDHKVDVETYPILQSHRLDGRPVVPFALIAEWLAHSAMHENPGLTLMGIDHLRMLKGIVLGGEEQTIRLMAGKAERNGSCYEVDVEIRNGGTESAQVVHSSARAILSDRLPSPPPFRANGYLNTDRPTRPLSDFYEQVLFHGHDLRGIQEILRISPKGMSARLAAAPPPAQWARSPLRSRWIADPLVLDCAFQMAIIWSHEQLGQLSLPSYVASYRQYVSRFPKEGVTAVWEAQTSNDRKLVGNFTFLNRNLEVIAALTGYEAIMDPLLVNAFKAA